MMAIARLRQHGAHCALLVLLVVLASCGGGGESASSSPPPPAPAPAPAPAPPPPPLPPSPSPSPGNVNIDNPTLTVANNSPVTPGGALRLVWSDEFNATRLDPEDWYFESGDGSQYGIPGWGNNDLQWYFPDSA